MVINNLVTLDQLKKTMHELIDSLDIGVVFKTVGKVQLWEKLNPENGCYDHKIGDKSWDIRIVIPADKRKLAEEGFKLKTDI